MRNNPFGPEYRLMREQKINSQRLLIRQLRSIVDRQFSALAVKYPWEEVVRRYTLAVLLREFTDLSLNEIASEVGIDHSTVVYGIGKIRHTYLYHRTWSHVVSVCLNRAERLSEQEIRIKAKATQYELA